MTDKKTKKKVSKKKEEVLNINPTMPAGLYWEWRCTIEEVKVSELNEKRILMERKLLEKDMEIQKLHAKLFIKKIENASKARQESKNEYDKMKKRIEEEMNVELKDCVIDGVTYEIRKINEPIIP